MRFRSLAALLVVSSVASSLLATSGAHAGGPAKGKKVKAKKAQPVLVAVAAAEPLPPLPTPSAVAPAAPAASTPAAPTVAVVKDRAPAAAPLSETPSAGRGFVLELGTGVGVLAGQMVKDVGAGAVLLTFDLRLGGYITPHFGVVGGVQGSYGKFFDGCNECNGFSYQFPVVAQYALQDRSRGLYFEGGLAFLSTYGGSTDTKNNPRAAIETLKVTSPVDLKAGIGYRIPLAASPGKAATTAMNVRLGFDLGQFKSLEYGSLKGDIREDKQALHYAFGLTFGYQFAP